ncbi:hypothetical protein ABZN45_06320 [Campylobacter sp. MRC_CM3]|nr:MULTISPECIES: hypothetical protein [unclassified Campylobacter]
MTSLDIFEIIFVSIVVIVGFSGMAWVIFKDKTNKN